MTIQSGILAELPSHALYATLDVKAGKSEQAKRLLQEIVIDPANLVVGVGSRLCQQALCFGGMDGKVQVPATPTDLWLWFRGEDPSALQIYSQQVLNQLAEVFENIRITHGFKYQEGRDLTGYEDGTENPQNEAARRAVSNSQIGGGSFVAVQKWQHDLAFFKAQQQAQQDNTIGRRLSDNEELDDAPVSAHVKRTAQESFDPEGFMVRRSMPYQENGQSGLMFVAFMHSTSLFTAMLQRMTGAEDGIVDGLFSFSRPLTGAFYWCPPSVNGVLQLDAK